jgi:4-hydroxybenzoate polyprenyltransferase
LALWTALVLASYIVGLSYIARRESSGGQIRGWPCLFLALPLLLAYFVNDTGYESRFYLLSIILLLWVVRCVRCVLWTVTPNIGRAVSGLLAGIVLVDLLAVGGPTVPLTLLFFVLFGAALVFQRFVPAT